MRSALRRIDQQPRVERRKKHQFVSIYELCEYLSLPLEDSIDLLKLR